MAGRGEPRVERAFVIMLRFLQASDFHLDSLPGPGRLDLPMDLREQLRRDVRTAASRALRLARERNCHIVLLPGDLFDDETATKDTTAFLIDELAALAPIPILITPGNHDYLSPASPYATADWPSNVHIFNSSGFVSLDLPDLDLSVTSTAQTQRAGGSEWLTDLDVPQGDGRVKILLFHGSRMAISVPSTRPRVEGNQVSVAADLAIGKGGSVPTACTPPPGGGWREPGKGISFDDESLLALGFDYAAIGHYHAQSTISDANGVPRAAYAGCPQGRGLDETGPKGALIGEISDNGTVGLEFVRTCERVIHSVTVDVSGAEHSGRIESMVGAVIDGQAPTPDDILHVRVVGRLKLGVEMPPQEAFRGGCAHVAVEYATRPDYDLDTYRRSEGSDTVASRFVAAMDEMVNAAADEDEKKRLLNATYYGLDALSGVEIRPRYEDFDL